MKSHFLISNVVVYPKCNYYQTIQLMSYKSNHNIKSRGEYLYGISPCLAAIRHRRRRIHSIFIKDNQHEKEIGIGSIKREKLFETLEIAKLHGVPLYKAKSAQLELMSGKRPHQGIVLDVSSLFPEKLNNDEIRKLLAFLPSKKQLWLFLNEIRDPMNLGAILRSTLYFGADKIFLSKKCCKLSPCVSKASSGAMEAMSVYSIVETEEFLCTISNKFELIGTCSYESETLNNENSKGKIEDLKDFKIGSKNTILIFGSEGEGLSDSIRNHCNRIVSIHPYNSKLLPMGLDSLNVSASLAILLYIISSQLK